MPFSVGDKFGSFKQLEETIADYEVQDKLSPWRRDSRTIANARAKGVKHLSAIWSRNSSTTLSSTRVIMADDSSSLYRKVAVQITG